MLVFICVIFIFWWLHCCAPNWDTKHCGEFARGSLHFFFVKVDQDLSYQCLHACLELVNRARHSTFMFFAIVMELSNGLMKIFINNLRQVC